MKFTYVVLVTSVILLSIIVGAADSSEQIAGLPLSAVASGNPINLSNEFFDVYLESDTFIHFRDFQKILFIWANITNKGNTSDKISFDLTTDSLELPEWSNLPTGSWLPSLGPGGMDYVKMLAHATLHGGERINETAYNFSFLVTSREHPEVNESFTITVVVPPESNESQRVAVGGVVSDVSTSQPVSGAYVTLYLGSMEYNNRETDSTGAYMNLWCDGVDLLNSLYTPYSLTVPGYRLVVQAEDYETYFSDYLQPNSTSNLTFNVSLTPLSEQVNYTLAWDVNLSSPGVWEIAVDDNWTRFAVAMGKHPDTGDPDAFPTEIPFVHVNGTILWNKSVSDESWSIDVTGDGSRVACAVLGNDSHYSLWDGEGNEVWNITTLSGSHELSFSHNKQYLAAGPNPAGTMFVVYNTSSGSESWNYGMSAWLRASAFTPDDQYVAAGGDYELSLFYINGSRVWTRTLANLPYLIEVSNDSSRFMVADKGDSTTLYDLDGNLVWRRNHYVTTYGAMSSDGSVTVVLSHDGNVYYYNSTGGLQWFLTAFGGGGAGHNGVDVSSDGSYVAVGGGFYNTLLYDSRGNLLWRHKGNGSSGSHPYQYSTMSVVISPDASRIAAGYGYSNPKLVYFERVSITTTTSTTTSSTVSTTTTSTTSTSTTSTTLGTTTSTTIPLQESNIQLQGGWNLVSLPLT